MQKDLYIFQTDQSILDERKNKRVYDVLAVANTALLENVEKYSDEINLFNEGYGEDASNQANQMLELAMQKGQPVVDEMKKLPTVFEYCDLHARLQQNGTSIIYRPTEELRDDIEYVEEGIEKGGYPDLEELLKPGADLTEVHSSSYNPVIQKQRQAEIVRNIEKHGSQLNVLYLESDFDVFVIKESLPDFLVHPVRIGYDKKNDAISISARPITANQQVIRAVVKYEEARQGERRSREASIKNSKKIINDEFRKD